MRKHPHSQQRPRTGRKPPRRRRPRRRRQAPHGFLAAFDELIAPEQLPSVPPRRGRKPRVPLAALLTSLVFHFMNATGTLAEHFALLFEASLKDSACADRRARLPWQVFAELMVRALRPLAELKRQPEAFYRDWRLVALDGTQFSLSNTPANNRARRKAKSRRGRSAFAKLTTGVLVELGLHNPLAAAIGQTGQSEWQLALGLLASLPERALLLADRLHGCAAFAAEAWSACQRVGSHFLIRARSQIKVQVLERFRDGSRLVKVPVRVKGRPREISHYLELREIQVRVGRKGHRSQMLRLWTSLLDPRQAPAPELVRLYAQRWEHELYYRHLKHELRKTELLQSHTVHTAAQEIAALMLASALLARERVRAADAQLPVLRVSFVKTLELLRPLWLVFEVGADLLSPRVQRELLERFYTFLRRFASRPRRSRSCRRAVRQPVTGWPRMLQPQSVEGPLQFTLV
jgi:hypothetical protein